jgi:O-antigen/teichoic acid export membrane protein
VAVIESAAPPPQLPLRARILRGLGWKLASETWSQIFGIAVAILLARLLTPHDYGVAAMVIVFATLVPIFADLALGAALIQRRHLTEEDRSTVFWTSAATGAAFTAAGIGLSWTVADFYNEPAVQPLFAALSCSFFFSSLGSTQAALLNREMNFRALELRAMAGVFAGGVLGVALAATGYGPWAIVGQQVVTVAVSTVLLWVLGDWRPRFIFSVASLRKFGGFSAKVFGTRILFYLNRNVDNLLVGKALGAKALGLYALAYNVMLSPMSRLSQPIQTVFFPAFAELQDDLEKMRSMWLRVNRLVGAVTIPAMLGLVVVAPEFVEFVLGKKWDAAVPVIQVLAGVGLLQSLQSLNSSILQARDRAGVLLWYSLVALVLSLIGFFAGLPWGVVGVAAGYAIASVFIESYYTWLTARALELPALSLVGALSGVIQAAIGMFAVVFAVRAVLPESVGPGLQLLLLVLTGIVVYGVLCAWRAPDVREEVQALVRRRRRRAVP